MLRSKLRVERTRRQPLVSATAECLGPADLPIHQWTAAAPAEKLSTPVRGLDAKSHAAGLILGRSVVDPTQIYGMKRRDKTFSGQTNSSSAG